MDTTCVMCRERPGDRQSTAGRWFCDTCVSSLPSEQDTLAALNGEIQTLTAERDKAWEFNAELRVALADLTAERDAYRDAERATQALYQSWHDRALKAEAEVKRLRVAERIANAALTRRCSPFADEANAAAEDFADALDEWAEAMDRTPEGE